jgi:hypothetical protein
MKKIFSILSALSLLATAELLTLNSELNSTPQIATRFPAYWTSLHQQELKKITSPLEIQITNLSDGEVRPNHAFILQAEVSSSIPLDDVSVRWDLPEGLNRVYGPIISHISHLDPGVSQFVELKVTVPDTSKNYQVHAHALYDSGSGPVGAFAQYNLREDLLQNSQTNFRNVMKDEKEKVRKRGKGRPPRLVF